jgi:subtilisin-like proprotein convertase family protein
MPKDRLFLALLLSCFALMGFGCDEPADNPGEGKMPDRADAANPLLRHYFDTNTFPAEMAAWKIPEGDEFKDETLEMNFSMGGGEPITDVRVRVFLVPPDRQSDSAPEVRLRVIAPDGTTSAWEEVFFVTGNGGDGLVDHNAEVVFANEFDGIISTGSWKVQLRDPVEDEDGRCLLRNATLRLNGGLPMGSLTGSETVVLPLDVGPYDERLFEISSPRSNGDIGFVGVKKPLELAFTFTNAFAVRRIQFVLTVRRSQEAAIEDVAVCVTSPSGGWFVFRLSAASTQGTEGDPTTFQANGFAWNTRAFDFNSGSPLWGSRMPFLGEPSAGTWRIYLWDNSKDGVGIFLSSEEVQLVPSGPDPEDPIIPVLSPNVAATMQLS